MRAGCQCPRDRRAAEQGDEITSLHCLSQVRQRGAPLFSTVVAKIRVVPLESSRKP